MRTTPNDCGENKPVIAIKNDLYKPFLIVYHFEPDVGEISSLSPISPALGKKARSIERSNFILKQSCVIIS